MSKQAFKAKRATAFMFDPDDLVVIGIDRGDKDHPLYDARVLDDLDEAMIKNIMVHGVLQTINIEKDGDEALVVDGRRRVINCREANRRLRAAGLQPVLVPAMVKRGDEKKMLGIFVSANEIRKDDAPTAKAAKAQRLLDASMDESEVAITFGVTTTTVRTWLKLLGLAPKVRKAVDAGVLSASAAAKLGDLSKEEQVKHLDEMVAFGATTTAEAGRRSKNSRTGKTGEEATRPKPTTRLVKKVLVLSAEGDDIDALDPEFVRGIRFMLGDLDPKKVKGLTGLLRGAATPKKALGGKKKPPPRTDASAEA